MLTREAVHAEGVPGGFSAVYDVLKAMEEAGKVRRGYFVAGLGATQFALPGAEDRLRARARSAARKRGYWCWRRRTRRTPTARRWDGRRGRRSRPQRAAGAHVVLRSGELIGYMGKTEKQLLTFLPGEEPERGHAAEALVKALAGLVEQGRRKTLLIAKIDGVEAENRRSARGSRPRGSRRRARGISSGEGGRRGSAAYGDAASRGG